LPRASTTPGRMGRAPAFISRRLRRRIAAMLGRLARLPVPTGSKEKMVVLSAAKYVLWRVGVRRGVAKVDRKWRNSVCAGSESRKVGGDPDEKCFPLTRTAMEGDNDGLRSGQKGDPR
jgi:hypothetical protein